MGQVGFQVDHEKLRTRVATELRGAAERAIVAGNFADAIASLDRCLRAAPSDSALLYMRAKASVGIGHLEPALDDLRSAIERNPSLKEQASVDAAFATLRSSPLQAPFEAAVRPTPAEPRRDPSAGVPHWRRWVAEHSQVLWIAVAMIFFAIVAGLIIAGQFTRFGSTAPPRLPPDAGGVIDPTVPTASPQGVYVTQSPAPAPSVSPTATPLPMQARAINLTFSGSISGSTRSASFAECRLGSDKYLRVVLQLRDSYVEMELGDDSGSKALVFNSATLMDYGATPPQSDDVWWLTDPGRLSWNDQLDIDTGLHMWGSISVQGKVITFHRVMFDDSSGLENAVRSTVSGTITCR